MFPRALAPLLSALVVTLAASAALAPRAQAVTAAPGSTARILPIAPDAFAGSAVNVIAQLQNTLFTAGDTQFAAFYAADGAVVLARRPLGADTWETRRTLYRGDVADAHKTIALAVDGAGYLHVAWDHHMDPLRYARGVAPGSLELGPKQPMLGALENKVTYPTFLRLPDGDLLFLYRDGVSGEGNLVLNRYRTAERRWTRVHANLLDGQGHRSAYIATAIDARGTLHLA